MEKIYNKKVSSNVIVAFMKGVPASEESLGKTLKSVGIEKVQPNQWYPLDSLVRCFDNLKKSPAILRQIGSAIPGNVQFPPNVVDTKSAFESLGQSYIQNHQGSDDIGYYKLVSFDEQKKTLVIECNTPPYPEDFNRGLILGLLNKFKPKGGVVFFSNQITVTGTTYTIKW